MNDFQQIILKGQILSRGIGYGKPIFLDSVNIFEENKILEKEIEEEISKFKKAVVESKKQITQIKKSLSKDKLSITFDILNTQLEIINDPLISEEVTSRIKKEKKSIEAILGDILLEYKKKIKDPFFREKALDLADVFKRITTNVKSIKVDVLKKSSFKSIIISSEIIPSDAFEIDSMNISAFISFSNSYESHAAIIARSKNIPFISNVNIEKLKNLNLSEVIVDADNGKIVVNPTIQTHEKYQVEVKNIVLKKPNIKINKNISLYANVSSMAEIHQLVEKRIKGIGLLRTELLFLENKTIPSEQIQY
ncbi:MAG: phosphoenolpyruvate-utilizing N-terminal domain-containing protein, partial [Parachlamydiales bacterium]